MNLREYFYSLTSAERARVNFIPAHSADFSDYELQAFTSMQAQWDALLRRAGDAPLAETPQSDESLRHFLGDDLT